MTTEVFANNATTTLGSAASSGATTMTLATGTGALFPTLTGAEYFVATLWAAGSTTGVPNEIVHVTAISGDTATVVRGQEGTTPTAWSVGDTFANYLTAATLNGIPSEQDIQLQAGNSAVDAGTANAGVITLSPAITAYSQILFAPIRVYKINSPNTGAYTLNVNGIGAQPVTVGGVAMAAGQLLGHKIFEVFWDGAGFELLSVPAVIENTGLAQMPTMTVKGNTTGGSATPQDVLISSILGPSVILENLAENGGYRIWSDGFKECWGKVSVNPNSTVTVSLPYAHTTWVNPGGNGMFPATNTDHPTGITGLVGSPPTGFQVTSAVNTGPVTFYWNSRGV